MDNNRIVNVDEMRYMDEYTCNQLDMSSLDLMQQAGGVIYLSLVEDVGIDKESDQILVVSGVGNNGGDGLVVAMNLSQNGYMVKVVIVGKLASLSNEAKEMLEKVKKQNIDVLILEDNINLSKFAILIRQATLLIDAIFGIGLKRNIEGLHYDVINVINLSSADVASIDIPSGINADNGLVYGIAVKADFTFIIQNYKVGNLIGDAADYHGSKILLDIGILKVVSKTRRFLINQEDYLNILPSRLNNTHKYHYGNVLTIGGSKGMMGAPLLSAYAALRCGSGLSSIAYKEKYQQDIIKIYPEIMTTTYQNINELIEFTNKKNVVIFGPGLGKNDEENLDILRTLLNLNVLLVIDADGIYYLKQLLNEFKSLKNVIITPHYGEMAMLLDLTSKEIEQNPLEHVKVLTNKYKLTVILKASTTIIANENSIYFSNYGNPGMATAGSGDVLSGIVGSMIGKGLKIMDAAKIGVLLHSMAGEAAKDEVGEESLIAIDIIKYLPTVLKKLKE